MTYMIPRTDICMNDPMPFSQHWEIRIPISIEALGDLGASLRNSYDQFKPGDMINVCCFQSRKWERVTELAAFRVTACNPLKIETIQVTETIKVPAQDPSADPTSQQNLKLVEVRGAFEVRDALDNVIELFVEREQAVSFIESYKKITAPKEASKPEDRSKWTILKGAAGKWLVKNEAGEMMKEFSNRADAEKYLAPDKKAA